MREISRREVLAGGAAIAAAAALPTALANLDMLPNVRLSVEVDILDGLYKGFTAFSDVRRIPWLVDKIGPVGMIVRDVSNVDGWYPYCSKWLMHNFDDRQATDCYFVLLD